jgi:hypothetical protein
MNPSDYQQVMIDAEVEHDGLILCLTRVGGTLLFGYQEIRDEQRVVNQRST